MERFTKKKINQFKKDIKKERLKLFKKDDDDMILHPKGRKILSSKDLYIMRLKENPKDKD